MDQLYNHPDEMRYRLLGKYNTPAVTVTVAEGENEAMLMRNAQRA